MLLSPNEALPQGCKFWQNRDFCFCQNSHPCGRALVWPNFCINGIKSFLISMDMNAQMVNFTFLIVVSDAHHNSVMSEDMFRQLNSLNFNVCTWYFFN